MALVRTIFVLASLSFRTAVAGHVLSGNETTAKWRTQLLANYSPSYGPLRFGEPLAVKIGFYIRHVPHVNLLTRQITVEVYLRMQWSDPQLFYDFDKAPQGWSDTEQYIPLMVGDLWEPDIVCSTCQYIDDPGFRNEGYYLYNELFAQQRGYNVHWSRQGTIISGCTMDLTDFPFDHQRCLIRFESWKHTNQWMVVEPMEPFAERGHLFDEGSIEYEMQFAPRVQNSVYKALGGAWPSIAFEISLKRKTHYYVVHAVAPMGLMVVLSAGVFWMPLDVSSQGNGERLSYAVTLMLTITATTLTTAEMRPAVGYDTWLDRYQYYCILFTCLPILQTVVLFWLSSIFNMAEEAQRRESKTDVDLECPITASRTPCHHSDSFIIRQATCLEDLVSCFCLGRRWSLRDVDVAVRVAVPFVQCVVFGFHFRKVPKEFHGALYENVFGIIVGTLFLLALFGSMLSIVNRIVRYGLKQHRKSNLKRAHLASQAHTIKTQEFETRLDACDGDEGKSDAVRSADGFADNQPDTIQFPAHNSTTKTFNLNL